MWIKSGLPGIKKALPVLRKGFATVWCDDLSFTTRHSKTLPQMAAAAHIHVMKKV
jgi:hypothetical protein